ncbi:MAG TPA: MFS transporter [Herpetosiphonaceae bacterium]|nr:MFS transporter [Herpetosiphonaceae bacterium]
MLLAKPKQPGLPAEGRWLLLGTLITNIGDGMHTITVGKLFYDKTGSVLAFGFVIVIEYVINFLLQFIAGTISDQRSPKTISMVCDLLRGSFIILASLLINTSYVYLGVLLSIGAINIAKPFYRAATFALTPLVIPDDRLIRYNSILSSMLQAGQLLGVALVGPILFHFGTGAAFLCNGLSFVISGLCIMAARVGRPAAGQGAAAEPIRRAFFTGWREIFGLLKANRPLLLHIVLCCGDFLAVNFINIFLVPLVEQRYGGNSYWLSAFDGAFAVGAMLSFLVVERVLRRHSVRQVAWIGTACQAAFFLALSGLRNPYATTLVMAGFGLSNTISLTLFLSQLQKRAQRTMKGRIASTRYLVLSLQAGLFIPIVGQAQARSLAAGLLAAGLICAAFSLAVFVLSRPRFFGGALLEEPAGEAVPAQPAPAPAPAAA